jgi:hypothetical protein
MLRPGGREMPTKQDLMKRIRDLQSENDDLQAQLDEIADIVTPPEDDGYSEDQDDEDDDLGEE